MYIQHTASQSCSSDESLQLGKVEKKSLTVSLMKVRSIHFIIFGVYFIK